METDRRALVGIGLLFAGALLMLAAAGGLFTGDWNVVRYAAPVAVVGLAVSLLGMRRLEKIPGVGG